MDKLTEKLNELNTRISELENQIAEAEREALKNIEPLNAELARVKKDKREYGLKSDFESVQACVRKENNLKFKISAQWNRSSMLKDELTVLKGKKGDLQSQIQLEKDKIRRNEEIKSQMDRVIECYRKTRDLKKSAVESKIQPSSVEQWLEWGKNKFNDTYAYFYNSIVEIDNNFRDMQTAKLKKQMDGVVEAYRKTDSLEEASKLAGVSYDTVCYWYEWGSRGFGEENTYFFKKIDGI